VKRDFFISLFLSLFIFSSLFVVKFSSNIKPLVLGVSDGLAQSAWPVFHGDSKLTGQSEYDTSHVDGTIKWRVKTEHWIESSPVIGADGTIYFADHSCTLYAVDESGSVKWKFSGGEPVYSKEWDTTSCSQASPAVAADGTIYFLPMTGHLYAVNPEGKEKWKFPVFVFKNVWTSPTVAMDGTIYVGSEAYPPSETGKPQEKAAHFYAINPDGTLKWSYNTRSVWMNSVPSLADDGTIYAPGGFWSEEKNRFVNAVYAFSPDGEIRWTFTPPGGVLEGSITIGDDGTLYFTTKGEHDPRQNAFIYALTSGGKVKWTYQLEAGSSMTPGLSKSGNIYIGDWSGNFYALNTSGKLLWKIETPSGFEVLHSSPAIGSDGSFYFGSGAGFVFAFTPEGEEKWRLDGDVRDGGVMGTPAIGGDGTVYVTTLQRELLAIGSASEAGVSTSTQSIFEKSNTNYQLIVLIVTAIAILVILFLLRKKVSKKILIILILFSVLGVTGLGFFMLGENKDKNTKHKAGSYEFRENREEVTSVEGLCPERVYGSEENGYYATFYINFNVEQFDITSEHVEWAQGNCDETIWPQDMFEGYRGK